MVLIAKLDCGYQWVLVLTGRDGDTGDGADSGLCREASGGENAFTTESGIDGGADGRTEGGANGARVKERVAGQTVVVAVAAGRFGTLAGHPAGRTYLWTWAISAVAWLWSWGCGVTP